MATKSETRQQGRVKTWKAGRGFGFIARTGERDIFVHVSALSSDLRRLADGGQLEGTEVTFTVTKGPKGHAAESVLTAEEYQRREEKWRLVEEATRLRKEVARRKADEDAAAVAAGRICKHCRHALQVLFDWGECRHDFPEGTDMADIPHRVFLICEYPGCKYRSDWPVQGTFGLAPIKVMESIYALEEIEGTFPRGKKVLGKAWPWAGVSLTMVEASLLEEVDDEKVR